MIDNNNLPTDETVPTPAPAAGTPADVGREPIEAPELTASGEAAEVIPAAEVIQEIADQPNAPGPVADEVAVESQPVVEPVAALPTPTDTDEQPVAEPLASAAESASEQPNTPAPVLEPSPADTTVIEAAVPVEVQPTAIEATAPNEVQPAAAEPAPAKKPRKSKAAAPDLPATTTTPSDSVPVPAEPAAESKKKWYVVKVQSGREDSIKAAIERKVKIEGLEEYFGQIVIPVEEYQEVKKVSEKKNGERVTREKKVIKHRKKFPGYVFAEVEFNDRILYLFRETSGVGDFVGASQHRAPTPMTDREVQSMLTGVVGPRDSKKPTKQVVKLEYEKGDKVKIRDGPFANMEGEVKAITEAKEAGDTPKVTVEVTIFGRGVPVELDYWHVDKV